ncbi:lactate utilization protein [Gilvimarinus agarilyticus]|uniref:LutC/YkgG family protein n=1 Tax=Gilvimarinus sp. 2_MG-2023 TaxID=3062666 RepID=UPI001C0A4D20|nr:lactate utilization protein [Gilvimarinus sp. 2_MG-2023]MBU2885637.1 lactate utilization protein [Gilvimarinus agarilyticus]MDO6570499.1 lactate utilization protein [Gilvimarinus sp. 2_MG-2023]
MSNAREKIFAAIARNKKPMQDAAEKSENLIARVEVNTIPARGNLSGVAMVEEFEKRVLASAASIEYVSSNKDVPEAIVRYLAKHQLPNVCFANGKAGQFSWSRVPELDVRTTIGNVNSPVVVTEAFRGIAETGSLVLISQPGHSSASHFLPEYLIIILPYNNILPSQESVWEDVRQRSGDIPRTVNLVTGPSRTGDIEQKMVLGAHGPRQVHLVVVK